MGAPRLVSPECHPDRKHHAFGLCAPCYLKKYNEEHKERLTAKHKDYWHKTGKFKRTKEDLRALNLFRRFGLTPSQYADMLASQKGRCAICHQPETAVKYGKPQSLSVDHDHETGKVRGLLCHLCNISLGGFRDDPDILQSAIDYLLTTVE